MIITTPLKRSIDSMRLLLGAAIVSFEEEGRVMVKIDISESEFSVIKYIVNFYNWNNQGSGCT
jgi:hypothetical protein